MCVCNVFILYAIVWYTCTAHVHVYIPLRENKREWGERKGKKGGGREGEREREWEREREREM